MSLPTQMVHVRRCSSIVLQKMVLTFQIFDKNLRVDWIHGNSSDCWKCSCVFHWIVNSIVVEKMFQLEHFFPHTNDNSWTIRFKCKTTSKKNGGKIKMCDSHIEKTETHSFLTIHLKCFSANLMTFAQWRRWTVRVS